MLLRSLLPPQLIFGYFRLLIDDPMIENVRWTD